MNTDYIFTEDVKAGNERIGEVKGFITAGRQRSMQIVMNNAPLEGWWRAADWQNIKTAVDTVYAAMAEVPTFSERTRDGN